MFIFTRFSVYDKSNNPFAIKGRQFKTEKDYLAHLYGEERLQDKFHAFLNLTVPSILSQTYENYEWVVFTSKEMPVVYRRLLERIIEQVPRASLVYVSSMKEFVEACAAYPLEHSRGSSGFTTVRIDDDDAIHPTYLAQLADYTTPGTVITSSHGYAVSLDQEGHAKVSEYSYAPACVSTGLALVGGSVFDLGNHATVHRRFKDVIFLPKRGNYLIYSSPQTYTRRKHTGEVRPLSLTRYFRME